MEQWEELHVERWAGSCRRGTCGLCYRVFSPGRAGKTLKSAIDSSRHFRFYVCSIGGRLEVWRPVRRLL